MGNVNHVPTWAKQIFCLGRSGLMQLVFKVALNSCSCLKRAIGKRVCIVSLVRTSEKWKLERQ